MLAKRCQQNPSVVLFSLEVKPDRLMLLVTASKATIVSMQPSQSRVFVLFLGAPGSYDHIGLAGTGVRYYCGAFAGLCSGKSALVCIDLNMDRDDTAIDVVCRESGDVALDLRRRNGHHDRDDPPRGRSLKGERLNSKAPFGHWGRQTFVAELKCDGLIVPGVVDAPMNRAVFEIYVETQLARARMRDTGSSSSCAHRKALSHRRARLPRSKQSLLDFVNRRLDESPSATRTKSCFPHSCLAFGPTPRALQWDGAP